MVQYLHNMRTTVSEVSLRNILQQLESWLLKAVLLSEATFTDVSAVRADLLWSWLC